MGWEAGADWVWATYRPARVVVPYAFGPPLTWDPFDVFRRKVWMRAGAPSAMCTEHGFVPMAAHSRMFGALGPMLNRRAVYDLEGNEVREPGSELQWKASGSRLGILYEFVGEPVRYAVREDCGFRRCDGTPVIEPRVEFQGLVRVDEFGEPLAEADVPLSIQMLLLLHEKAVADASVVSDTEVDRHLVHVRVLADLIARRDGMTARAWLDIERLRDVEALPLQGGVSRSSPDDLLALLDADTRTWNAERPATRLGPGLGIAPRHWGRRDTPGWGRTWAALDVAMASVATEHWCPSNGADLACLAVDGNEGTVARVRSYMAEIEPVAKSEDCTVHRDGNMTLWSWESDGVFHLAAARDGMADLGLCDPLMTEEFPSDGELDRLSAPGAVAGALSRIDLSRLLVERGEIQDYAALGLMAAHARGMTFADLCATQAEIVRWPMEDARLMERIHDFQVEVPVPSGRDDDTEVHLRAVSAIAAADASNVRTVMALRAMGGKVEPLLERILAAHDDYGFCPADAALAEALVRACRSGATLRDLAAAATRRDGVQGLAA